jgi:predicted MPP superfamily phosphohydrolase
VNARRRLTAAATVAAGLVGTWAIGIEPGRVRVRDVEIGLPAAPELRGVRLAVMGDIHTGAPHIDSAKLIAIVEDVNRPRPDVVVLLGDYVIDGVVGGRFVAPEETVPPEVALLTLR